MTFVQLHQARSTPRSTLVLTGARNLPHSLCTSQLPFISTMTDKSNQSKKRNRAILSLDVAIGLVDIGKEASSMTPAPAVFGIATILLTTIRVSYTPPSRTRRSRLKPSQDKITSEQDCVDLGILCADVCDALRRGMDGKRTDELSESTRNAINRLEA